MSIRTLSRCGAVLLLTAIAAGCSSTSSKPEASTSPKVTSAAKSHECKANRSKCLYKGAYESGERDYAEQEAKRLNLAELERLRRAFGK